MKNYKDIIDTYGIPDTKLDTTLPLKFRQKESHEDAVKRYLAGKPKNETDEQRAERIKRFRCGY